MKNAPLLLNHCSELYRQWEKLRGTGKPADEIRRAYFRERHYLGSRDRRFIDLLFYDMIRNLRLYEWQIRREREDISGAVPAALLTVHAFLRRFPDEAETARYEIADDLAQYASVHRYRDIYPEAPEIRESMPDMVWERIRTHYSPSELEKCLTALNTPAEVHLRVNTRKISPPEFMRSCKDLPLRPGNISPDALRMNRHTDLTQHPFFKRGLFELQDESSQLVAFACRPKDGDTVIDLCAGAGGKTLHLAALQGENGALIATDIHADRLERLDRRAKRAGVRERIRILPLETVRRQYRDRADILLIDAPCTGSGVFRRNPDSKWTLSGEILAFCLNEQANLLRENAALVKPGGKLVYATCSIIPDENEKQIEAFLADHSGFSLMSVSDELKSSGIPLPGSGSGMLSVLPHHYDSDGFFIAVLTRGK
ncbi:MAG: RsmB/NOP family class I SAM-dependent RNA methyltransferase [Candidatus Marinimicrobia bacterium]|nr:RsmB/NOP family class I SAM-dependent RNA methyltransferase [Candidatus Neomarinimicrobiota bacterium]